MRSITCITCMITLCTLGCVSVAYLLVSEFLSSHSGGPAHASDAKLRRVQALLASVVAVGRSPSSAIAIVSELRAEGPFTLTVLSVTMVTDVLVILLFTVASELAHTIYSGSSDRSLVVSFLYTLTLQLSLSVAHGVCLAYLCLPILGMRTPTAVEAVEPLAPEESEPGAAASPHRRAGPHARRQAGDGDDDAGDSSGWAGGVGAVLQPAMMMVLGGYAFGAEALLKRIVARLAIALTGHPWDDLEEIRIGAPPAPGAYERAHAGARACMGCERARCTGHVCPRACGACMARRLPPAHDAAPLPAHNAAAALGRAPPAVFLPSRCWRPLPLPIMVARPLSMMAPCGRPQSRCSRAWWLGGVTCTCTFHMHMHMHMHRADARLHGSWVLAGASHCFSLLLTASHCFSQSRCSPAWWLGSGW